MRPHFSSLHFPKRTHATHSKDTEAHWAPNTDVYVADDGLVIKVELAGMRREDLELTGTIREIQVQSRGTDGQSRGRRRPRHETRTAVASVR